ncbi:MAG: hypothetical protein F6K10_29180 [Moorea sp. SIO2B7]|nr:hypothetical protein [Moorena sp. SIO2B7]
MLVINWDKNGRVIIVHHSLYRVSQSAEVNNLTFWGTVKTGRVLIDKLSVVIPRSIAKLAPTRNFHLTDY